MLTNLKADVVLISQEKQLKAKNKVIAAVRAFILANKQGEKVPDEVLKTARKLVSALEEHDEVLGE